MRYARGTLRIYFHSLFLNFILPFLNISFNFHIFILIKCVPKLLLRGSLDAVETAVFGGKESSRPPVSQLRTFLPLSNSVNWQK